MKDSLNNIYLKDIKNDFVLTPIPYEGSLLGIKCKILHITTSTTSGMNTSVLRSLITTLNGSNVDITVNVLIINESINLSYDSQYDVVVFGAGGTANFTNVHNLLNTYYSNGKGVVTGTYAPLSGLTKMITTYGSVVGTFNSTYNVSINNNVIFYGVTSLVKPFFVYNNFIPINGATSLGSYGGLPIANYLDN
jgi:hypothetical protein